MVKQFSFTRDYKSGKKETSYSLETHIRVRKVKSKNEEIVVFKNFDNNESKLCRSSKNDK